MIKVFDHIFYDKQRTKIKYASKKSIPKLGMVHLSTIVFLFHTLVFAQRPNHAFDLWLAIMAGTVYYGHTWYSTVYAMDYWKILERIIYG